MTNIYSIIIIALLLIAVTFYSELAREGMVEKKDVYTVNMLAPKIAQHGKKELAYHPSKMAPGRAFLSDWTIRTAPFSPLAQNRPDYEAVTEQDMGWVADPKRLPPITNCRPSLTGVYDDCGPYGWNIDEYKYPIVKEIQNQKL